MLRAVYVRTLKPGVTDDEFVESWLPETQTRKSYPADVTIARSLANARQVISVFDVDVEPDGFATVLPDLVHPDSEKRLAAIVESTELEAVFAITERFGPGTR